MKALSLTQPWATLVAIRAKRIETRSWPTKYRGSLAIHAAKGFPRECKELCFEEPFRTALIAAGIHFIKDLPLGVVVAVCELRDCRPTEWLRAQSDFRCSNEFEFGNYDDHRFGFLLANVEPLIKPVLAKGALGLWGWREEG